MSQKSILSFFKPPKVKAPKVEELIESYPSSDQIITSKSPEKTIRNRRNKKAKQLVESDEEICEGLSLDDKGSECPSVTNEEENHGNSSEELQNETETSETQKSSAQTKLKNSNVKNGHKSSVKIKNADMPQENIEEPGDENLNAEVKELEDEKNRTTVSLKSKSGVSRETKKYSNRKAKVAGKGKSKEIKSVPENLAEEEEKCIGISDKSPKTKRKYVKKRKSSEIGGTVGEKALKKQKNVKNPVKIKSKNHSNENEGELSTGNGSLSDEMETEDCPEIKAEESDEVKTPLNDFFTRKTVRRPQLKNDIAKSDLVSSAKIENADVPQESIEDSGGENLNAEVKVDEKKQTTVNIKSESDVSSENKKKSNKKAKVERKGKGETKEIKPKFENIAEEEEQCIAISDKSPKPKRRYVRKKKTNDIGETVGEKALKNPVKIKREKHSGENESELSTGNDSVSDGMETEECPEIKESKENEDVKTQFHSFFTSTKKEKLSEKHSKEDDKNTGSTVQKADNVYEPSKKRYHPIDDACWKRGEKVPYLALAKTMEAIESISGRLRTIEVLANFLRSVIVLSPEDLLHSVYLCLNKLAPEYMGIEMGIGETLLMKAVAQATGRTVDKIKAEVALKGDLGLVAENSRGNQRVMFAPPKLTISSVFSKFKEIAQMSGNSAMAKKVDKIQVLFVACRLCEAKYIIRSLSGKLRIGMAEQSVLAALAQAATLTPPNQDYPPKILNASTNMSSEAYKKKLDSQALILKTTYCECPNYDLMIPILLKEGIEELPKHCHLSPGIPLKPMLAHPTKGIEEVLRRFDNNEFTCEFKYDGERAQIHVTDGREVKIYSRNQEDNTSKYPDVVSRITKALKSNTKSCIIDTEAVAWDKEAKQILPFQVLSTRKRKDAVESEITVRVCIVAFDLLYLNDEPLVKLPLKERRKLLHDHFSEVENEFLFVKATDGNSAEVMQEFLEESIKGNCEGLMVKSLEVDASYEIAKRSHNWLKLKKDYLDGVGDTLDLVVIGGFHGKGKRCGGYGGFLLACYDDENEEFQSICKIGTGFKEEEFESHTAFLKQHVIVEPKPYYRFDNSLEPDVWFEPVQVWEVKCADLSISPVHKAAIGMVDPEKGISLRFPRFLRIRDDKKTEEATTASQVANMYSSQEQVQNQKSNVTKMDDEDFY